MTKLKLCEPCTHVVAVGGEVRIIKAWSPIEPAPCCANCYYLEPPHKDGKKRHCNEAGVSKHDFIPRFIESLCCNFYCSHEEMDKCIQEHKKKE